MTLTHNKLSKNTRIFNNLTGLTIDQFNQLLDSVQDEIILYNQSKFKTKGDLLLYNQSKFKTKGDLLLSYLIYLRRCNRFVNDLMEM